MLVQGLIQKLSYIYEAAKIFWRFEKQVIKEQILAWCISQKPQHFWRTVHSQAVGKQLKKNGKTTKIRRIFLSF